MAIIKTVDFSDFVREYSEYTWQEIASNYNIDLKDDMEDDDKLEIVREYLENKTYIVDEHNGVFVYAVF